MAIPHHRGREAVFATAHRTGCLGNPCELYRKWEHTEMQSSNNPSHITDSSKFPMDVSRVGPDEVGGGDQREEKRKKKKKGHLWGSWKDMEVQRQKWWEWRHMGQMCPDPQPPHYTHTVHRTVGARPSSVSSGWGVACMIWKRSVKLQKGKKCLIWRELPLPVRFQIMFCNSILACDRASRKWDNSDAKY